MTEDMIKKKIASLFEKFTGVQDVKYDESFSSLGGTSLTFLKLLLELEDTFNMAINNGDVSKNDTVNSIADMIKHKSYSLYPIIDSARFLYDRTLEMNRVGDSRIASYNYSFVFRIEEMTVYEIMKVVYKILNAHPVLKAKPVLAGKKLMMQRRDDYLPEFTVVELNEMPDLEYFKKIMNPIRLMIDEPLRCKLYHYDKTFFFVLDIHHILLDGFSIYLILNDFRRAFANLSVTSEENNFFTVSEESFEFSHSEDYLPIKKFYNSLLRGIRPLKYPKCDSVESDIPVYGGSFVKVPVANITKRCDEHNLTPYIVMMAAFLKALEIKTGEKKFSIINFSHGRQFHKTARTVGCLYRHTPVAYKYSERKNIWEVARLLENQLKESDQHRFIYDCFPELADKHYVVYNFLAVNKNASIRSAGRITDKVSFIGYFEQKYDFANIPLQFLVTSLSDDGITLGTFYNSMMYTEDQMKELYKTIEDIFREDTADIRA